MSSIEKIKRALESADLFCGVPWKIQRAARERRLLIIYSLGDGTLRLRGAFRGDLFTGETFHYDNCKEKGRNYDLLRHVRLRMFFHPGKPSERKILVFPRQRESVTRFKLNHPSEIIQGVILEDFSKSNPLF